MRGEAISENDGVAGYCRCEKCRALDADLPGERFLVNKTDRYVNFWNRLLTKMRAKRPDVMAETQVNAKGELVLHLLRPDNETVLPELTVSFADPRAAGRATLYSFEKECKITDTRFEEGRRTAVLRDFRTMASMIFN